MAASRLFGLNLGMQTVSVAEFRATGEGLALAGWKTEGLIADPSADATRMAQIESAVSEARQALHISKRTKMAAVLPSQSVIVRFARLPGTTEQDVHQIIPFEAQQNIPFQLEEVVWDYQIVGQGSDGSWDVLISAIKTDQLSDTVASLGAAGVSPSSITVAPVALFNAFRYNYPEAYEGATVLIDIGARTTNVLCIEGNRFFSRTIPVGGNSMSAAIAKEIKQDVTLAEHLKIEKGFVGLGGAYAEPDDATAARISKVIRNTMTRLHTEVARSISFYRQNQGGAAPARVLLAGGAAQLPYTIEFFNEKLQLPVEYFNALRKVSVASPALAAIVGEKVHMLGEVVGAALQAQGTCEAKINLRPPELVREQDLAARKPFFVMAAALLILALGAWCGYYAYAVDFAKQKLEAVKAEIDGDANAGLKRFAGKIDEAIAEQRAIEKAAAPLVRLPTDRSAWAEVMDTLGASLPARFIWVTTLSPIEGRVVVESEAASEAATTVPATARANRRTANQPEQPSEIAITEIEITGLYLQNPPNAKAQGIIDEFVNNLAKSPVFTNVGAHSVIKRMTPNGQQWAYDYTIKLKLTHPIAK